MFTIFTAQCCTAWPVVDGWPVRDCGKCGKRPVLLPMLRIGTLRP
jgi:hypothetical protein